LGNMMKNLEICIFCPC